MRIFIVASLIACAPFVSMPFLETTSSSAVQDYVFKGDPSKAIFIFGCMLYNQPSRLTSFFQGGFCVQQTAPSKVRAYAVPTPFRETSLCSSIRGLPHSQRIAIILRITNHIRTHSAII
jgi:hypothetical protein